MNLDKQHAVLEEIFEYLLSNGRKDLVDKYNNSTKSKETKKICTARKKWKCCKCRQTILKGTKYFCITITQQAMFISKRYCLSCHSLPGETKAKSSQLKMKFMRDLED